ncbi:MAG: zinc-binding dehydrogenase, partial [bacterium]
AYETIVTGVCSHRNTDFVLELGADNVIDYTEEDFAQTRNHFDIVYDAFGNRSLSKVKNCLRRDGRYVTTDIRAGRWLDVPLSRIKPGPVASVVVVKPGQNDLESINDFVTNGELEPVVDSIYSLRDAPQAHRYSESRRARGKIILEVA